MKTLIARTIFCAPLLFAYNKQSAQLSNVFKTILKMASKIKYTNQRAVVSTVSTVWCNFKCFDNQPRFLSMQSDFVYCLWMSRLWPISNFWIQLVPAFCRNYIAACRPERQSNRVDKLHVGPDRETRTVN